MKIRQGVSLLSALAGVVLFGATARANIILDDFESGDLAGWTLTGSAWTAGGPVGSGVTISAIGGSSFARSGAPNSGGALAESNTGTVTSSAFTVTYDTLGWLAVGWSGEFYDGQSYYEILDGNFNSLGKFNTAQSDNWRVYTLNLITDLGLTAGSTFYFRAVDGNAGGGYAWMGMDSLQLLGEQVAAETPEPGTWAMLAMGLGAAAFAAMRRNRRVAVRVQ